MSKPYIDRQGKKELDSTYGKHYVNKTYTQSPAQSQSLYSRYLKYIPVVVAILTLLGIYIRHEIEIYKLNTKLVSIEKKIDPIVNSTQKEEKEVKCVCCYVGLMKPYYLPSKKTSWGIKYDIKKNICEINEQCNCWEKLGLPGRDDFIEIHNPKNGKDSWAKVIGKFKDIDNPNRALIISEKVKSVLFPGKYKSGISMRIRLIINPQSINEKNELFNNS